jgi:hypothetical protein
MRRKAGYDSPRLSRLVKPPPAAVPRTAGRTKRAFTSFAELNKSGRRHSQLHSSRERARTLIVRTDCRTPVGNAVGDGPSLRVPAPRATELGRETQVQFTNCGANTTTSRQQLVVLDDARIEMMHLCLAGYPGE